MGDSSVRRAPRIVKLSLDRLARDAPDFPTHSGDPSPKFKKLAET
jgi:hypothetical protein